MEVVGFRLVICFVVELVAEVVFVGDLVIEANAVDERVTDSCIDDKSVGVACRIFGGDRLASLGRRSI